MYLNLLKVIVIILAENGETRTLTLLKLINQYIYRITVEEPMVFDYALHNIHEGIILPFPNQTEIRVDWGDGEINEQISHFYDKPNQHYRIKIYNKPDHKILIHNRKKWADNITDFITLGRININDLNGLFMDTKYNGKIHPNWDTTNITSFEYMFKYATEYNQKIPDNWDTSNIWSLAHMFSNAYSFNQKLGDNWDTSNVRDMSYMFCNAHSFNQKFGDNWDTSNVRDMKYMFCKAWNFNQKFGDNWDTSNVTDMDYMFCNTYSLNQTFGDNWDVSNVKFLDHMFNNPYFNQKRR